MTSSLGAVLNAFAGLFNVFPKAVGRIATEPDNDQKSGDEYHNHNAFNESAHIYLVFAFTNLPIDLAIEGPLFWRRTQVVAP